MTEAAAPAERPSLVAFSNFLSSQQDVITEQWLLSVRRDTQIEAADRMPTPELVDHLPRLLRELCDFLRTRDINDLTRDARRDASKHGELRWRDGYKIDELVRELEAFRWLVTRSVFHFREIDGTFKGPLEVSAIALIQQFFAEITVVSVRQFMNEQQSIARACVKDLADVQQQLGRSIARSEQTRDAQHRVTRIVALELRYFLQRQQLSTVSPDASRRLNLLIRQLLGYAEAGSQENPAVESFDPRELFSEVVAIYRPVADEKRLQLLTECLTAPAEVQGIRARIKNIAELLLDNAIEHTATGHVCFTFSFPDADHWAIKVSDTGPGLSTEDSAQLFGGNAATTDVSQGRGMGLAMAKDLATSLGGTLQTVTQAGLGTRMEVSFPRLPQ